MQYIILKSRSSEDLSNQVNTYLQKGWEPLSGHQVIETNIYILFSQSLIKKEAGNTTKMEMVISNEQKS